MITLINKNGDQPMSLGDRGSYFENVEATNLPRAEKGKAGEVPTLRQKFRVVIIRPRPCQVDQEHQISQNLGDAISERFASVIKKH